jgi:hypothetical protein
VEVFLSVVKSRLRARIRLRGTSIPVAQARRGPAVYNPISNSNGCVNEITPAELLTPPCR